jgi:hypothetical protein
LPTEAEPDGESSEPQPSVAAHPATTRRNSAARTFLRRSPTCELPTPARPARRALSSFSAGWRHEDHHASLIFPLRGGGGKRTSISGRSEVDEYEAFPSDEDEHVEFEKALMTSRKCGTDESTRMAEERWAECQKIRAAMKKERTASAAVKLEISSLQVSAHRCSHTVICTTTLCSRVLTLSVSHVMQNLIERPCSFTRPVSCASSRASKSRGITPRCADCPTSRRGCVTTGEASLRSSRSRLSSYHCRCRD